MANSSVLVLGSPIKDHLAHSMPGPAGAGAAATSGPTLASGPPAAALASGPGLATGARTAGILAAGSGSATAPHIAAGAAVAKTAVLGSLLGSLFYTAAVVAVGYVGYRAAKAVWEAAAKKTAKT